MASTDLTNTAQHSEKEERLDANQADLKPDKDLTTGVDGASATEKGLAGRSRDASPASRSSASGVSSTKGGTHSPVPTGSGTAPPLSMPHPKKFSHVNISKKFLEKSSSASTPIHTLSSSPVLKTVNTTQKSTPQAAGTHPRLVTAKLTATPQPSSTSGWSRPSSAVPSNAPTPPAPNVNSQSASSATSSGAPLPPPVGKVIQPQPRGSQDATSTRKDSSTKPVWGNGRGGPIAQQDRVQADFPTAAEVAQALANKITDKNSGSDAALAHKQAARAELMAEEDTFRGVHLDPNAHHWDEMEEDDDNFLGGVIEFGDGRQYKVQPSEGPRPSSPPRNRTSGPGEDDPSAASRGIIDRPVSKEERFEDDFDRSWPRSRSGPHHGQPRDQRSAEVATSPTLTSVHSPQELSRVLFNERSNRLEPYSHQRHAGPGAPGAPAPFNRRSSRSDYSLSPTEPRRDGPPHTQLQGVQLLQKGYHGGVPLVDAFSRAPGDRSPISPDASRFRERQSMRRDQPPWHAHDASDHSRPGSHNNLSGSGRPPHDAPFDERARRSSTLDSSGSPDGEMRRQLPPHLSPSGARHVPPIRTDHDLPRSPRSQSSLPAHSEPPVPSASSQAADSPATPSSALPPADVEEVRKAAMHTAAERARLRRQQEEAEREKEKERARRKAAEIEERMKAAEEAKRACEQEKAEAEKQQTDSQVLEIIEEAVSSVSLHEKPDSTDDASDRKTSTRSPLGRAPSSRGGSRPFSTGRPPLATTPSTSDVDTWRRKGSAATATSHISNDHETSVFPILPPTTLAHANLELKEGEDVDVVDFADLGKLVGSEFVSQQRASASDFFGDEAPVPQRPQPPPSKADEGPWRRRASFVHGQTQNDKLDAPATTPTNENSQTVDVSPADPSGMSSVAGSAGTSQSPPEGHHRRLSGHLPNGTHKLIPSPHYREAPMSTLNDTMARIKGALAGMHIETEPLKEAPKPQKWLPPALRSKGAHAEFAQPTEVFDVTSVEPPKSPKKAWNIFTVRITHDPRPAPPPLRTELVWPRGVRLTKLDVYSWTPPIDVVARRDISFNDYLYGGPRMIKGKPKYFVSIPRKHITRRLQGETTPASPVVNLPNTPPRLRNGTAKEPVVSSWRKPPSSPTASWRPIFKDATQEVGLDTVSRSPPPEAPSIRISATTASLSESSVATSASNVKPKLPVDSDVSFYRTARAESSAEPVKFTVSSELEGESKLGLSVVDPDASGAATLSPLALAPAPAEVPSTGSSIGGVNVPSRELTNGALPSQRGPSQWSKSPTAFSTKENLARAPDPEHLKAVWSQTPDKSQIQPVNSLKGIADDMPSFSLQDVKSDDGTTPPPSGPGPWTRMTAYEVTRAFQQVPTPSSSSSQRPPAVAPPANTFNTANGAVSRNPTFAFSPPPMSQPSLRPGPAYPSYSPMMTAPSMYAHTSPVPRPMTVNGGATSPYGQPVWMHAMPGPPPQSAGLMRSPYPAQLVPYPSPGGPVPMYPGSMPGMQNQPPLQNGAPGRPPGMPLVSPVMQPALPQMYAGSPVLVHAAPVMSPGQNYAVPAQSNRGPMRPYEQNPGAPHMSSPMRQPPQNGYNPVQPSYVRPPW